MINYREFIGINCVRENVELMFYLYYRKYDIVFVI